MSCVSGAYVYAHVYVSVCEERLKTAQKRTVKARRLHQYGSLAMVVACVEGGGV